MIIDAFAFSRIALGATAVVSPSRVAKSFGLGSGDRTAVAARMLGGRDLFMGLGLLLARRHGHERGWLEASIAVDAVDALCTVDAARSGAMEPEKARRVLPIILASVAVGAYLVWDSKKRSPESVDD